MRPVTALLVLVIVAAPAATARADSLFDALARWLDGTPDIHDVPDLRERAADGNSRAQLLLFESYRTAPRGRAGPRVSSDMLVSRAEAEAGLRTAAAQDEPLAVFRLGVSLHRGGPLPRDPAEARHWLEKAASLAPESMRPVASRLLGESLLLDEGVDDAGRARGMALTEKAIDHGFPVAIRAKARALAEGIGRDADPAAARRLLEDALASGNDSAAAPLGDMLVRGTGGPADPERGLSLLDAAFADGDRLAGALLAAHWLEGRVVGPHPRKAIALMAPHAESDLETRQALATLLVDYAVTLPNAPRLFFRLQEDEDVGAPEAAWTLLRLLRSHRDGFRDDAVMFDVIERNWQQNDRIALLRAENLARFSTRGGDAAALLAREAREIVERLAEEDLAAAWTLKGRLLRRGAAYPQDDVAATAAFAEAAALGDPDAMVALAAAHGDGLGVPEDDALELHWMRKAAAEGSIDARRRLVGLFSFDMERRMTLREGLTERVALYGDGIGSSMPMSFIMAFGQPRIAREDRRAVVGAFMDGFRAAPAALEERRLVPLIRPVPREVWAAVEARLAAEGFYAGDTSGHMGPEARAALAAWVKAAGPLPPYEPPKQRVPPQGPALPAIPPPVLDKAIRVAFADVADAKTRAEGEAAVADLAALARLGAAMPRWALLRAYHGSTVVRAAVSAEEMTRFALDLLLTADPRMDKLAIEFAFATAQMERDGAGQSFADGFLSILRDDARLRDPVALDDMLHQFIFAPQACTMLLDGARARGVDGLPADECAVPQARKALLVHAEAAGPSGVEAAARAAAVPAAYAIAGVPYP